MAHGVAGAVDLARFAPRAPAARARVRAGLGLDAAAPLFGVVARIQRHRRFDLVLDAAAALRALAPGARIAILGRGTHAEALVDAPVRARGLGDVVVRLGRRDADYPDVLAALDALLFLVPGSDGGCRAVLEAAACGVPVVASRRGALPELVAAGGAAAGVCVDEGADAIARALASVACAGDAAARERARSAVRAHAERAFAPARLARDLEALYEAARARRAGAPAQTDSCSACSETSSL
ncbi:MAG: glycosyltransferase [Myxococcota bacterium]